MTTPVNIKHTDFTANNNIAIVQYVTDFIQQHFDKRRVLCLILYGSALSESETVPNDYDLLLLLDTFHKTDYQILKIAKSDLPLELFLDYKDQILKKGLENYQRGRHGTYFIGCLAYGQCILGNNFYLANFSKIPKKTVQKDLLFRLEEYFYRIQQHYINDGLSDDDSSKMVRKYVSRICMDMLLYSGELSFADVHRLHYLQIGVLVSKSVLFSQNDRDLLEKLLSGGKEANLIASTIQSLYKIYLDCFEKWTTDYNNCN